MKVVDMKNKFIYLILLLLFLFIWYEARPAFIRSNCANRLFTSGSTSDFEREQLGGDMNKINAIEREKGQYYYKLCLNEAGLAE